MYTIMEDPVILPSSKVSIDLSTIKSHLLSDPTDPFNRIPLKLEDVIPSKPQLRHAADLDVALKAEIAEFRRNARAKARNNTT
jgi:ubiquitin conjugation factor E4 B